MLGMCREAAVRAYNKLSQRGVAEINAFTASVTVYQHHHPDSNSETARKIVARWIDEDLERSKIARSTA